MTHPGDVMDVTLAAGMRRLPGSVASAPGGPAASPYAAVEPAVPPALLRGRRTGPPAPSRPWRTPAAEANLDVF